MDTSVLQAVPVRVFAARVEKVPVWNAFLLVT